MHDIITEEFQEVKSPPVKYPNFKKTSTLMQNISGAYDDRVGFVF